MRDIKIKLKLIWLIVSDQYTRSKKYKTWYMWDGDTDIVFGRKDTK